MVPRVALSCVDPVRTALRGTMAIHLTKRVIDAAKPGARRLTIFDDALRGFALRVEPSGIKSFIVRYRANGGGRARPSGLSRSAAMAR
jgi:hypothetical protein